MLSDHLSLISFWYLVPERQTEGVVALKQLARDVLAAEPDTLSYVIHVPFTKGGDSIQSLPPSTPHSVLFYEVYRTPEAFLHHLNGPVFKNFVERHGSLFLSAHGAPFTTVEFLSRVAGFSRERSFDE